MRKSVNKKNLFKTAKENQIFISTFYKGWIEFEFWIWIRSRIIDEFEFDFCKINKFEFSFFEVWIWI